MPRPFKRKRTKHAEVRDERREVRIEQARENGKRRKVEIQEPISHEQDFIPLEGDTNGDTGNDDSEFYGFLTEDEQAYYSSINTKIVANDFENDEERQNFIQAVYRESEDKELKLASSQSCSRYLERLILVSTPDQLLALSEKLSEGLTNLAQHRFGSHVLETLFSESAKYVKVQNSKKREQDETSAGLEACFIQVTKDLEPNIGFLLTDQFGSHVVRNLVLVLSGEQLQDPDTKKILASKKKERLDKSTTGISPADPSREVPESFKTALSQLIKAAVSSLDSTYLRALATHPTGNPVLQLLLRLELTNSDKGRSTGDNSLFHRLLSPDSLAEDSESAKFVAGLTYDSTGSHLIEIVVQYAPGKTFKKLYKHVWGPRLASMAKNDVASYVVIKIMQRLGKDDLADAQDVLLKELPGLIERHRFLVIQTLVERCVVRGTKLGPVAEAIKVDCGAGKNGLLRRFLQVQTDQTNGLRADAEDDSFNTFRADTHGSLLVQSLLQAPEVSGLVQESLLATDSDLIVGMAKDSSASRVLQSAINSPASSPAFRKQMIPKLYGRLGELATNPSGSYLVEALWDGTSGLHFIKERIAGELAKYEHELRDSLYGRNVWRNWLMDLYSRRFGEWQARAKGQDMDAMPDQGQPKKSAIQLARERHVQRQTKEAKKSSGFATGANAIE